MDDFLNDLRHSVRMFLKSPGFSMIAVAAVALGIGANTAIFSIVNTVLFEPLPVSDPDHLVALGTTRASSSASTSGLQWAASPTRLMHWRSQSSVLQDVSAFFPRTMNYTGGEAAEQWRAMQVSADVFRCWRTPILLGRAFAQDEDIPNSRGVVMMSWNRWARRFCERSANSQ